MVSQRQFIRGLLIMVLIMSVLFGLEFLFEWHRLGRPSHEDLSWATTNNAKLVDVLSPMARAYNNVLAMLLAGISIAIPLTANMYTPKLIDMFLRDRINQVMLGFCALGAGHVLWAAYLIGPNFPPTVAYRLAVFGALAGWAVVVPYVFYVIRFLDPLNILARLKEQVVRVLDRAVARNKTPADVHEQVHEALQQIGTFILKSIDRGDRSVALNGIWSLKQVLDHYHKLKEKLPPEWFHVERKDMVGMSAEALEIVNEDRTWFEHKAMTQMFLAYQNALAKAPDEVSALSDATRVVAFRAAQFCDDKALHLAIRFFNNYLREAIKKKDVHALYDLFYQYRRLADDLVNRPQLLAEIGRCCVYYNDYAATYGLYQMPLIIGHDLGWIVARAFQARSPAASGLLDNMLSLNNDSSKEVGPMVIKAKAILGSFFVENHLEAEADRVRANLAEVPPETLERIEKDMLTLTDRSYWEVTDRQVNWEWVPPERRAHVQAFIDSLRHAEIRALRKTPA